MNPDRLFALLDGQELTVAGQAWRVQVHSVSDEFDRRWLQLSLNGDSAHMLTLNLKAYAHVRHAVLAISSWLADPSRAEQVLNVA